MIVYQVKDWNDYFENNKSREREKCSFVCVPNKQHGLGFSRVVDEKDGAAIYGIWCMILGACSRQIKPREGWLTHDGHPTGTPWAPDDLAVQFRRPEDEIRRALEVLTSPKIGWLRRLELSPDGIVTSQVPAECPPDARSVPMKRREENGRIERETRAMEFEIEPPPGFPANEHAAAAHAAFVGCPEAFAIEVWNETVGRGFRDRQGHSIGSFRNYLSACATRRSEWERRQARATAHVAVAKPQTQTALPKPKGKVL